MKFKNHLLKIVMALCLFTTTIFSSVFHSVKAVDLPNSTYIREIKAFEGQVFSKWEHYSPLDVFKDASGRYYFCVEPAVVFKEGDYTKASFPDSFAHKSKDGPYIANYTPEVKKTLSLIAYFGFQENPSDYNAVMTNIMIWEEIGKATNSTYYQFSRFEGADSRFTAATYNNFKNTVNEKIRRYKTIPSFDRQTITLKTGESTTLTDSNAVLDTLKFENKNGFIVERLSNSQLKITATKDANSVTLRYEKNIDPSKQYESVIYRKDGAQTMGLFGVVDPVFTSLKVNVIKEGRLEVTKVDGENKAVKLQGATFELLKENTVVQTQTTGQNGVAYFEKLQVGDYTIREKATPKGYRHNPATITASIQSGATTKREFSNYRIKGNIEVLKVDGENNAVKLPGAVFELSQNGKVITTATTDNNGIARFISVSYGTYTIKEIKAPVGYRLNTNTLNVTVNEHDKTYKLTFNNYIKKGNIEILKVASHDKNLKVENAEFELQKDGKTIAKAVTDKDGIARFNDVVFGTYTLVETKAPKGYFKPTFKQEVNITEHEQRISFTVENEYKPSIQTQAFANNEKSTKAISKVVLKDVVNYQKLIPNKPYLLELTWMNKATGEPFKVNGKSLTVSKEFVPTQPDGQEELSVEVDADAFVGTNELVAFESLQKDGIEVAAHADIKDLGQTVRVVRPTIKTRALALDTNLKNVEAGEVRAKDIVTVTGFEIGERLTFQVRAVNKNTGEFIKKDGKIVSGQVTVDYDGKDVEVPIILNTDEDVVLYEYVYSGDVAALNKLIIKEENKENKDQTLYVPKLKTTASSKTTNSKTAVVAKKETIVDVVEYSVRPFTKGVVKGKLMDKDNKKPLLVNGKEVTQEKEFTADETGKGSVTLEFTIDSSLLAGKTTVVFEEMYEENTRIGIHKDFNDEGQTVYFPKLKTQAREKTSNTQTVSGQKETQTVIDTVYANNLVIGKEYTISGFPVRKSDGKPVLVNGKPIERSVTFIAKAKNEIHKLAFDIPASALAGEKLVFFEKLSSGKVDIVLHHDINDKEQTVNVSLILDIQIAKTEKGNVKHFLQGAEFTVFNQDGTIAKDIHGKEAKGVTDKNGKVSFQIFQEDNNQLYVMETKAPKGYHKTNEKFKVVKTAENKLGTNLIEMNVVNEAIIIPKTGINAPIIALGSVAVLALLGVFVFRRKKQ